MLHSGDGLKPFTNMQSIMLSSSLSSTAEQKKKIRHITKAASTYKGHSLNKALLTGPDILCDVVGILPRFQQFAIAVAGDIESILCS